MEIPFIDLKAQYLGIKTEIDNAIQQIISTSTFIGGEPVKKFELEFSKFLGVGHCISCANGTDSIEILLQAMGVGMGDEVIVPAYSWISTSEAVSNIGATPVFVDIEPDYYCINPSLIEAKITKKTKAIIPVHFYGQPANMPEIISIAKKYKLKVLEDCAQAHNATINGKKIGTWGDCASFSFYPGKNLGAYGDAGAMVTNDASIAERARRIANHGQLAKHDHLIEGRNSRLDSIQAAVLSVKLPYLNNWTIQRNNNAKIYDTLLDSTLVKIPKVRPDSLHVYHLYVIRSKDRNRLQAVLAENSVQTAIHYPSALPFLPCYGNRGFVKSDFPVSYELQSEIISIPMYPELTKEQQVFIAGIINEVSNSIQ